MSDCADCVPLQQRAADFATLKVDLSIQTDVLVAQRDADIADSYQAISDAWADWRRDYSLYREAKAQAEALQDAIDAGGLHPDLSLTQQPGWIEHTIPNGPSIWARNEQAAQYVRGAVSTAMAMVALPAARAAEAAGLAASIAAVAAIRQAEADSKAVIDGWAARLQAHIDLINDAARNERDYDHQYRECMRLCGEENEQNILLAILAAMLMVLGTVALVMSSASASSGTASSSSEEAGPETDGVLDPVEYNETEVKITEDPPEPEESIVVPEPEQPPLLVQACSGTDHSGVAVIDDRSQTEPASLSRRLILVQAERLPAGSFVVFLVNGRDGPREGDAVIMPNGFALLDIPLLIFGNYTIASVTVDSETIDFEGDLAFVVDSSQQICTLPDESEVPATTSTTSTTTSTTIPGTGTPTPSTTAAPTGGGTTDPPPPAPPGEAPGGTITTGTLGEPDQDNDSAAGMAVGAASIAAAAALAGTAAARRRREDEGPDSGPGETPAGTGPDGPTSGGPSEGSTAEPPGVPNGAEPAAQEQQITEPMLTINGSNPGDSLNGTQAFELVVELPRTDEPPQEYVTVDISATSGDDESLTIKWDGNITGPPRYTSHVSTLNHGGEGEETTTIAGFEFVSGGFNSVWFDSGEEITFTVEGSTVTVTAYDTWVQQSLAMWIAVVNQYDTFARSLLAELESMEETEERLAAKQWAETVLNFTEIAIASYESDELDTTKLALVSSYGTALPLIGTRDTRELSGDAARWTRHRREEYKTKVLDEGMTLVAIGLYRTVVEATPAASAWTAFTGTDIFGNDVTWDAQLLAALEFAGWVSLAGGLEVRGLASSIAPELRAVRAADRIDDAVDVAEDLTPTRPRTPGTPVAPTTAPRAPHAPDAPRAPRTPDAPETAPRTPNAPDAPVAPRRSATPDDPPTPTRPPADSSILEAPAGTPVTDFRPFGMKARVAGFFQTVADRYGLRIRVRAANQSSLRWMDEGHPPKHVKLKAKTINDTDLLLGAPEGSQGLVGYFRPRLPDNFHSLPAEARRRIAGRFRQRLDEFIDNRNDMNGLQERGLVSVEDGVVIDRGLSSTRLGPDGHLHPTGADPAGTGKAFTGDHDMWDITNADGSIVTTPRGLSQVEAAKHDLANGVSQTQHGPHKEWVPNTPRDIDIDARIRASHGGELGPDGRVGPQSSLDDFGRTRQTEGLVTFKPDQPATVSYEMGDGQ